MREIGHYGRVKWVRGHILKVLVSMRCWCQGKGWGYLSVGGVCCNCMILEDGDGGCSLCKDFWPVEFRWEEVIRL